MKLLSERFWPKVEKSDGCWIWTANKLRGYGRIKDDGGRSAPTLTSNRASWKLTYGPIPPGMCVCHRCDNPSCVNPDHLFLGTPADNARDRDTKGRTGQRKLDETKVLEIRALAKQGVTQSEIGRRFGIAQSTAGRIIRRVDWSRI